MEIEIKIPIVVKYQEPEFEFAANAIAQMIEKILTKPEYLVRLDEIVTDARKEAVKLLPSPLATNSNK